MRKLLYSVLALSLLASCEALEDRFKPKDEKEETLLFPASFDFSTLKTTEIAITAKDINGAPFNLQDIKIFDEDPDNGGTLLYHGGTNPDGVMEALKAIPSYVDKVYIQSSYDGLNNVSVPIIDNRINYTYVINPSVRNGRTTGGTTGEYYYYESTDKGFLAFESLWPAKGDFDLNDLVVKYNFKQKTNSKNQKITKLTAKFTVAAIGAVSDNLFRIAFPGVTAGHISKVSLEKGGKPAQDITPIYTSAETIVEIFNAAELDDDFLNTIDQNRNCKNFREATLVIEFSGDGISKNILKTTPYNPFICVNNNPAREVHLVNAPATKLAEGYNADFPGSDDKNKNYRLDTGTAADQGMPFAVIIPGSSFKYPKEYEAIYKVYPDFITWSVNGGKSAPKWYAKASDNSLRFNTCENLNF